MRSLVRTVRYNSMDFRKLLNYLVIDVVKRYTVMYIAGSNFYCQNNTMNIAGCMCFISQLLLVVVLYEQTAVRICGTDDNSFLLSFLLALL